MLNSRTSIVSALIQRYIAMLLLLMGRDISVGIVTRYELDGPGIETRWGARFPAFVQIDPEANPASCTMGTGDFSGVKRPGRGADHPPHLSTEYMYSPSGPSLPVLGRINQPFYSLKQYKFYHNLCQYFTIRG